LAKTNEFTNRREENEIQRPGNTNTEDKNTNTEARKNKYGGSEI